MPLLLFTAPLIARDKFSLTKKWRLGYVFTMGAIGYVILFLLNQTITASIKENNFWWAFSEEFVKGLIIYVLVVKNKVALMSESTIYGAAVGSGFGTMELFYHCFFVDSEISGWYAIFLGFEASVMHIGCSATFASMILLIRRKAAALNPRTINILSAAAFIAAFAVHFVHMVIPIHPIVLTAILTVYFIYSKRKLFKENDEFIHEWIDSCINNDIQLLASIRKGELSSTHAGIYLEEIKERFSPEVFFDMLCYVSEYLELSIAAKSRMIMKEAGVDIPEDPMREAKICEIKALRKRIGYYGEVALRPIVDIKDVDKWVIGEV